MAKKQVKNASFSQNLSAEDKKHYEHSLVVAADGMTYRFSNPAATVGIIGPRAVYNNFKDFEARITDAELRTYWSQTHTAPLDEAEYLAKLEDRVEFVVEVWILLVKTATDRLKEQRVVGADGKPVRNNKKMLNRSYDLVKTEVPADMKMPPQAKTCLQFLVECAAKDAAYQEKVKAGNDGIFSISEKDFNAYVVANAERLKTRQDPWRIFQYYRPELIKGGFLRLV